MTPDQVRVPTNFKRSLGKLVRNNLRLLVYDGAVFVCPSDFDPQGSDYVFDALNEHGFDCSVEGLNADGGAGV